MYRQSPTGQLSFENFYLPFGGNLSGENRWVRLAELLPWEQFESEYAEQFSEGQGAPAKPFRMALGALIIKEKLGTSDEETVEQICENHKYFGNSDRYHLFGNEFGSTAQAAYFFIFFLVYVGQATPFSDL